MTTLREAAQQALEALESAEVDPHSSDAVYKAITALRAALAEPEPYDQTALELCEVCGWRTLIPGDCCLNCERKHPLGQASTDVPVTVYVVKKVEPVQEPVAYSVGRTLHWHEGKGVNDAQLYLAAPPQRKPLTEEEIHDCFQQRNKDKATERRLITRAVETAHGIK